MTEVANVADSFNWVAHGLSVIRKRGISMDLGSRRLADLTYSTSFSGIDAPGTALCMIGGHAQLTAVHLWAAEKDKHCCYELLMHPHSPQCLFGDVHDLIDPRIRHTLVTEAHRMDFLDLSKIVKSGRMLIGQAPCSLHHKDCKPKRAELHVAGTPCVDFSSQGARRMLRGPSLIPLLAWAAQRLQHMEPAILHENVEGVLFDLLSFLFAP